MRFIVSNQNTFASLNLFKFANSSQMVIGVFFSVFHHLFILHSLYKMLLVFDVMKLLTSM